MTKAFHTTFSHVRPIPLAAVGAGGLAGAAARYELGLMFPGDPDHWPHTTFAINIAGAFLLGVLLEALIRLGPDAGRLRRVRLLLGTGFLGSFTTYSTLAVEADQLFGGGHVWVAAAYLFGSALAGAIAAAGGIFCASLVARRADQGGKA